LNYPQAWIDYLVYFHTDQDYFECHEVLEEHWKNEGMKGNCWPGLIQIAVALYHQRRGNFNGAKKMMISGIEKLRTERKILNDLGLDTDSLFDVLERRKVEIEEQKHFHSLTLPLTPDLQMVCLSHAKKHAKEWNTMHSPEEEIINKHRLRDRTSIIEERLKQKAQKNRMI
jgi:predicted metal-dependent hydrolase